MARHAAGSCTARPWSVIGIALVAAGACIASDGLHAQTPGPGQLERQFGAPPQLPSGRRADGAADAGSATARRCRQGPLHADAGRTHRQHGCSPQPRSRPPINALVGREVSLADVFRLADELTLCIRNEGYVLSRVIVPPQNIRDGAVQLRVVEGYVAQTRIAATTSRPAQTRSSGTSTRSAIHGRWRRACSSASCC